MNISVFGSGSWGTALAQTLASNNNSILIYTRSLKTEESINLLKRNDKYLKDAPLNKNISASSDLQEVCNFSDTWLIALPSHAIDDFFELNIVQEATKRNLKIIHATKGLDLKTFETVSQKISRLILNKETGVSVISGPSHAEEVVEAKPTAIVIASHFKEDAKYFQKLFANENFRVYSSSDILGVEIGGSLKNIFGLAAGISDGLGYGDNARAAIIMRGAEEMIRVGNSLGADEKTLRGLTGMGDLIVTAGSMHSRNWKTGYLVGTGGKLNDVLRNIGMVAEGVKATKAAYYIGIHQNLELPIINAIYEILFEDKEPKVAVYDLMNRLQKDEF